MVHFLVDRYADGPRKACAAGQAAGAGRLPRVGVYHPRMPGRLSAEADLPRVATSGKRKGTVGLLLLRSYLLAGNAGHYDGVITALEARGLRVMPAFATGLDARPAIDEVLHRGRPPWSTPWSR
jgi:magnesium chelatase subunit H